MNYTIGFSGTEDKTMSYMEVQKMRKSGGIIVLAKKLEGKAMNTKRIPNHKL